jgi:hypothetical protein
MALLSTEIWQVLTEGPDEDPWAEGFRFGLISAIACLAPELLCARCGRQPVDVPSICAECSQFLDDLPVSR